ncbi:nucleotide exchange factor GrpE [Candidatus Beckwithbacteria bacterium CG10_big_fil_rev_8_21_14_0_10_34_10]|uniref:Protein GrpE n=1 Tax=Candidatus Beckwithbacteria bacterium CG10_big_fil_rev_8_21_14_0_10_34_10 TaxID=1974495 RepID=A0A2H0W9H0_9BACT|nr:MAG: nucleotide exchange factor GrpE [Candidatus Beckwithbacteria bacterium CG10_big_fil_rev_8_21_14_0_10_34_10]
MKNKKPITDKKEIANLQILINDLEGKWKRALADYANLEKRIETDKNNFVKFSNATLLDKFLTVLDDLERAEKHLMNKGLNIAMDQFRAVFKSEGVEEIKVIKKFFDPEKMDCVEMIKGNNNQVLEVVQKGYLLNNKVLRPAKVKVGKGG